MPTILDGVMLAEVARAIKMPSAFDELFAQYKVIADTLLEQANHAQAKADIAAASLRVGLYLLKLLDRRIPNFRRVQFNQPLHLFPNAPTLSVSRAGWGALKLRQASERPRIR